MTQRHIDVDGSTLFVDDRGDPDAPALLYVHGGPGMGCYEFMALQGGRLASRLRVLGVDQRGVLRSGPVGERPLSVATLVEDFEAVREALGISSWAVLGHSAGGAFALDYALACPQTVRTVLFECPCWDADATDRHRLPVVADLLDELQRPEAAARCRELAGKPGRLGEADGSRAAMQALGTHYLDLSFRRPGALEAFRALRDASGLGEETWERGTSHAPLLAELYVDRRPRLAGLTQPSVLLRGAGDLVAPPALIDRYRSDVPGARVHTFETAGHFPAFEEPAAYAAVVTEFVEKEAP